MWAQALDALARAERLHQQFFRPAGGAVAQTCWQPPVDLLETDEEVVVIAALPGVPAEQVSVAAQGGELVISGARTLPSALRNASIHRMELPQARFERRVMLPRGLYRTPTVRITDGCLVISLEKAG
jgi:HSP20 family molecular chaperone IbpA